MDGGARTFLSYRSCYTTQGDHLKWRSSFLNGLTNAHTKGHYRKVLYMKLEGGGSLLRTTLAQPSSFFHCIAQCGLGRKTTVAKVIDWGESIMFDHKNIWPRLAGLRTTITSTRVGRHKPRQYLHAELKAEASEYKHQLAKYPKRALVNSSPL